MDISSLEAILKQLIGPKGDQGPRGPTGPKGDDGQDGRDGDRGPRGFPGQDGKDGRDGVDGMQGPKGDPGPRGIVGPQGERGETGPEGKPGKSTRAIFGGGMVGDPFYEAPRDGTPYVRQDGSWVAGTGGGGIAEAPVDGQQYARKDAGWVVVTGGSGSAPRTSAASATFLDEDTSQSVVVADAAITANSIITADYLSEDFAIQNVSVRLLSKTPGVGYTLLVVAPDGATGQVDLNIVIQEAA